MIVHYHLSIANVYQDSSSQKSYMNIPDEQKPMLTNPILID